jgi:N-acylneuraminate cytidylyltransferase
MKVVALMPMKGNSERVHNKNMKDFNGKPLYHRVVETLLSSKFVNEVVINTDSKTITDDINKYFPEVTVLTRPKELEGDFVSMNKIISHDISNVDADVYVQTHSTNPLLKTETLDAGIQCYLDNIEKNDSVFSVTKVQTRFYDKDNKPHNHNPAELLRTQDLDPLFEENSNFFIFSKKSFDLAQARIGKKAKMFVMDKVEAIDIDEPEDFIIAEAIHKVLR